MMQLCYVLKKTFEKSDKYQIGVSNQKRDDKKTTNLEKRNNNKIKN